MKTDDYNVAMYLFQVKHEKSCKTVNKQRKVFDTAKQRATEELSYRQIKNAQKKVNLCSSSLQIKSFFSMLTPIQIMQISMKKLVKSPN